MFLAGENVKYIAEKAKNKGNLKNNLFYFSKKEDLQENLKSYLTDGDVVLIKASNGMKFSDVTNYIKSNI